MARICFLVGSIAISGGSYVILQHASHLAELGHEVVLAIQEPFDESTLAWHDRARSLACTRFGERTDEEYDLVIATWWRTAVEIPAYRAPRYAYFVQSIESHFYPPEEKPLRALIDATYEFPIAYVTEAKWIRAHLEVHFGHGAALVPNGVRKDVYRPDGPAYAPRPRTGKPRVLIEGHLGVPFKNVALSIKAARKAGADDVWMLTGSPVSNVPFVDRVFSRVPVVETPKIYRSCDFIVKLSTVEGMFGPPLEHFHCGGSCIVYDVTGHDEYIVNHVNGLVAARGDVEGVVTFVRRMLEDRELLAHVQAGAMRTAETWPDWPVVSTLFGRWVDDVLAGPAHDLRPVRERIARAWSEYERDEKARLAADAGIERARRRDSLIARLPKPLPAYVRSLGFKSEVLFHDMRTR